MDHINKNRVFNIESNVLQTKLRKYILGREIVQTWKKIEYYIYIINGTLETDVSVSMYSKNPPPRERWLTKKKNNINIMGWRI